jgi:hypothetical protein
MAKQIHTSIHIKAKPEVVWNILCDFEKYPEWNPFIQSISGELAVGKHLRVQLQGMLFKPLILSLDRNTEFSWLGKLWLKGLFDGEHRFYLSENADGSTTFEHSEKFRGILVNFLWKSLDTDTRKGFEAMNQQLKQRAENKDFA